MDFIMSQISQDDRSEVRQALDEAIANEGKLPIPANANEYSRSSMEEQLRELSRPVALPGVIENGVVRLLDSTISLPEHTRVIVVASQQT
jgi:hypothetical protein